MSWTSSTIFSRCFRVPAILSFLMLVNKPQYIMPTLDFAKWSSTFTFSWQGVDWVNEWKRCLGLGQTCFHEYLSGAFTPGSIQGVWEGTFTVRSRIYFLYITWSQLPAVHRIHYVCCTLGRSTSADIGPGLGWHFKRVLITWMLKHCARYIDK